MSEAKTCMHRAGYPDRCKNILDVFDFGMKRDGQKAITPACAYCDEHVDLYRFKDGAKPSKSKTMGEAWGIYAGAKIELLPPRVIETRRSMSDPWVRVQTQDIISRCIWEKKGALFFGDTGLGKTMTSFLLAKSILELTGRESMKKYCPELRMELAEAATSSRPTDKSKLIERLSTASHLFLDDIGSAAFSESFDESIKMIIEARINIGLPTYISLQQSATEYINASPNSSVAPTESARARRSAIIRRLVDSCIIFKFTKPA